MPCEGKTSGGVVCLFFAKDVFLGVRAPERAARRVGRTFLADALRDSCIRRRPFDSPRLHHKTLSLPSSHLSLWYWYCSSDILSHSLASTLASSSAINRPATSQLTPFEHGHTSPSLSAYIRSNIFSMTASSTSSSTGWTPRFFTLAVAGLAALSSVSAKYECDTSGSAGYPYCVNIPDGGENLPVILFLAGSGARGDASRTKELVSDAQATHIVDQHPRKY